MSKKKQTQKSNGTDDLIAIALAYVKEQKAAGLIPEIPFEQEKDSNLVESIEQKVVSPIKESTERPPSRQTANHSEVEPQKPDILQQKTLSRQENIESDSAWSNQPVMVHNDTLRLSFQTNHEWTQNQKSKPLSVKKFEEMNLDAEQIVKNQANQKLFLSGRQIQILCRLQGRCPLCTLVPPCSHSEHEINIQDHDLIEIKKLQDSLTIDEARQFAQQSQNSIQRQSPNNFDFNESYLPSASSAIKIMPNGSPDIVQQKLYRQNQPLNKSIVKLDMEKIYEESLNNENFNRIQLKNQTNQRLQSSSIDVYASKTSFLSPVNQSPMHPKLRGYRRRNKSGVYESYDFSQSCIEQDPEKNIEQVSQRLRTIEMISSFRQKKIQNEMMKLEADLKYQEQQVQNERKRMMQKKEQLEKYQSKIMESKEQRRKQELAELIKSKLQQETEWDKFLQHRLELKQKLIAFRTVQNDGGEEKQNEYQVNVSKSPSGESIQAGPTGQQLAAAASKQRGLFVSHSKIKVSSLLRESKDQAKRVYFNPKNEITTQSILTKLKIKKTKKRFKKIEKDPVDQDHQDTYQTN